MRYYSLEISGGSVKPATYTNWVNGGIDPGALNIEFDITTSTFAAPVNNPWIRVWGVSIQTIAQGSDFNGAQVTLRAGMAPGLPLANPKQQGVLTQGTVWQAFGNWIELNMTLDLIIFANGGATQDDPANIVLDWKQGTPLGDAIQNTLQTAYPSPYSVNVNISSDLILTEDDTHAAQTIEQFAQYVNDLSRSIITDDSYGGVNITLSGQTFYVYDNSNSPSSVKQIAFTDLIGQPTWIGPSQVQATVVMRGDLVTGDYIMFPPPNKLLSTSSSAEVGNQSQDKLSFSGQFQIVQLRHVGNLRSPDATSWITVINANSSPTTDLGAAGQPDAQG